ncbi:hypothetical protein [Paenibacillus sp. 2TAB19]|uniref:hypothetical protein n=1 Tax=Paenibacillus sp. 2TAB19 TaxID=3233003 RepID=UPI003F974EAE
MDRIDPTESDQNNSKCQIKRTAIVSRLFFDCAEINCDGRISKVALQKLASGIQVGDTIEWSGRLWVLAKRAEDRSSDQ